MHKMRSPQQTFFSRSEAKGHRGAIFAATSLTRLRVVPVSHRTVTSVAQASSVLHFALAIFNRGRLLPFRSQLPTRDTQSLNSRIVSTQIPLTNTLICDYSLNCLQ